MQPWKPMNRHAQSDGAWCFGFTMKQEQTQAKLSHFKLRKKTQEFHFLVHSKQKAKTKRISNWCVLVHLLHSGYKSIAVNKQVPFPFIWHRFMVPIKYSRLLPISVFCSFHSLNQSDSFISSAALVGNNNHKIE